MKYLLFLFIASVLFLSGCKKDETDACAAITCLNGGTCNDGNCFCPGGWTGTYCETQVVTDPCAGVLCLNGGNCVNGNCLCAAGYTGNLCENQLPAQSVRITKIECSLFPQTNNGAGWDNASGPDPYVQILTYPDETVVYSFDYFSDIVGNPLLSYVPASPISLTPADEYIFRLYDYDGFSDDYMGGMRFSFAANDGGFPSTLEFSLSGITLKFYLVWVH